MGLDTCSSDLDLAIIRGTHDGLAPVGAIHGYLDELPEDATYQLLPSVGHGMATEAHLSSWRAFVKRVADEEPSARPVATFEWGEDTVEVSVRIPENVTVDSSAAVLHVTSVHAVADDSDLRDAKWNDFPLLAQGVDDEGMRVWSGTFSPQPEHWAAFVEINGFGTAVTTVPHLSWESGN